MSFNKGLPLRRTQLITSFGPGALVISPEGESAVVGSLDKWYYDLYDNEIDSISEFEVQEPRLKSLLKVNKLLMPPEFRTGYRGYGYEMIQENTYIYIPLLRFPTWHYCAKCHSLYKLPLESAESWYYCRECRKDQKLIQVPFIVVCRHGHLSDFPWREWTHGNENTQCDGQLKLLSTGGATLDSLKVKCVGCGAERSLRGIMIAHSDHSVSQNDSERISVLSRDLNIKTKKIYKCPGTKVWYGNENYKEECSAYPVAVLKNSINVYFPKTLSAIYLPGKNKNVETLLYYFEQYKITSSITSVVESMQEKIKLIKSLVPNVFNDYKEKDIELALLYLEGKDDRSSEKLDPNNVNTDLRKKEYEALLNSNDDEMLKVKVEWENSQGDYFFVSEYFGKLNRVTKLKETVVLTGFERLVSDITSYNRSDVESGKKLLFKDPFNSKNNWLPAYTVYGEGIFFTLNMNKIKEWENNDALIIYFENYLKRIVKSNIIKKDPIIKPRNILLHTLSHIIIQELSLTCGYNSASIKERLYINGDQCGVLIYTSSGDSEGTFGGLVRMGRKENFFPVVINAIEKAKWCSSDPVCTEIGKSTGQGVNNFNGSACHNCVYLSETSCETSNVFLDRILLIDPEIGYFKEI